MGFFSELKEDLSQAVNELIPEEEKAELAAEAAEEAQAAEAEDSEAVPVSAWAESPAQAETEIPGSRKKMQSRRQYRRIQQRKKTLHRKKHCRMKQPAQRRQAQWISRQRTYIQPLIPGKRKTARKRRIWRSLRHGLTNWMKRMPSKKRHPQKK